MFNNFGDLGALPLQVIIGGRPMIKRGISTITNYYSSSDRKDSGCCKSKTNKSWDEMDDFHRACVNTARIFNV